MDDKEIQEIVMKANAESNKDFYIKQLSEIAIDSLKQLHQKERELKNFQNLIRPTKEYESICRQCRDDCMAYASGFDWGVESYTDHEVEYMTLSKIIRDIEVKDKEIEELKAENQKMREGLKEVINLSMLYDSHEVNSYTLLRAETIATQALGNN